MNPLGNEMGDASARKTAQASWKRLRPWRDETDLDVSYDAGDNTPESKATS